MGIRNISEVTKRDIFVLFCEGYTESSWIEEISTEGLQTFVPFLSTFFRYFMYLCDNKQNS